MRIISVGEFKDRLDWSALAIAVSTHPICVALREMLYDRPGVDLDSPRLYAYLMLLVNNNLPEADTNFPGSAPLTVDDVKRILELPDPVPEMGEMLPNIEAHTE
jgi:hypothetical protein